jgi:hypothetical protein
VFATCGTGTILHYNGTVWEATNPVPQNFYGLWGTGSGDVYAAGTNGHLIHFDGGSWTILTSNSELILNALWGTSGTDLYGVGAQGTGGNYWAVACWYDAPNHTWITYNLPLGTMWQGSAIGGFGPSSVLVMGGIGANYRLGIR